MCAVSLVLKDLTPVSQTTWLQGAGAQRWQHPGWQDHLPPCNAACPAGENIQSWLALAQAGDFEAAWRALVRDNPLPAAHGRACYHPCEGSCNRKALDEDVAIHTVERFLGDLANAEGWSVTPGASTGRRVLIVGAGPAGLSCAWQLRLRGHAVEIVDAMAEPGGMLHYGIPAYRLPRAALLREVDRISAIGVVFRMNTIVSDLQATMARGPFDACFVAIGAHAGNHFDIPAADGRKLVDAISLLEGVEAGDGPQLGRVVGIVGGGNTAFDAARVAKRLGAEEAIVIYRRDQKRMRAGADEAREAFLEGVKAMWLRQPVRWGQDGVTVERLETQADGSLRPTGALETLPLDALVLALGQHADSRFLRSVAGIAFDAEQSIRVDPQLMTGHPGIFAGGDAIGGARTMTAATGHGKKAARAIDAWLRGERLEPQVKRRTVDFGMLHLPLFLDAGRARPSELPPEARSGFTEVVAGIDRDQARREAARCLSCGNCFECDNCLAACPEQAISSLGRGRKYTVDLELCTGCAVCFDQCPCHAIDMVPEEGTTAGPRPARFKERP
jgi:NADPH-dependent glutamate synthase beta subunit-like oxidoreductase